jgi:hypothetical protein
MAAPAKVVVAKRVLVLAVLAVGVGLFVVASGRWQGQFDLRVYHGAVGLAVLSVAATGGGGCWRRGRPRRRSGCCAAG